MSGLKRWQCVLPRAVLLIIGLSSSLPSHLAAQPTPKAFRRVFVPQEALEGQVRGLLPLKREEFEQRLKIAATASPAAAHEITARIEEVTCRARLKGNALQDAIVDLKITSSFPDQVVVSLDPCNLELDSANWLGGGERPAVVGTTPSGSYMCVVPRSGTLRLKGNLKGDQLEQGLVAIDVRLPGAPRHRLEIETPANATLTSESGVIVTGDGSTGDSRSQIWIAELGGQSQTHLRIRTTGAGPDKSPRVVVRESTTYTILPSTVDLDTTFILDPLARPLSQFQLEADPTLNVTSLHSGDRDLSYSEAGTAPDGSKILDVSLPGDLSGLNRAIRIAATANWFGDRRYNLPRIRVSDGVFQEGRASVVAPAWMRLQARPGKGCYQTAVVAAPGDQTLEQFEFLLHAADAAIEITSAHRAASLRETSGTQFRIDATQVTGTYIAEVSSLQGARFELQASLAREWIVDAVEAQPPEMLADRQIVPLGVDQQLLHLRLAHGLSEGRTMRLFIRGHYRRPANQQLLDKDFFQLASLNGVRDRRQLVAVQMDDPATRLELEGDEHLPRLDSQKLDPAGARLFESPPVGLLFDAGLAPENLSARLVPRTSRYRADVLAQALVTRGEPRQTVSIRCQPEGSAVSSLLVRIAPRPRGEIAWRLVNEDSRGIQASVVGEAEPDNAADEATYRLNILRPRSAPFEVLGDWTIAQSPPADVSLAWLPEAAVQTNVIEIHTLDGCEIGILANDVQPLPLANPSSDRFTTLRARYRHIPGREARIRLESASLARARPAGWIESLQLISRFSVDGRSEHEALLAVQNRGLKELRLRIPGALRDIRIADGDADEGSSLGVVQGDEAVIPLPDGRREFLIRARYGLQGRPLSWQPYAELTAPIPALDLAVLRRRWTVGLPPDLATSDAPIHSLWLSGLTRRTPLDVLPRLNDLSRLQPLLSTIAGPAIATQIPIRTAVLESSPNSEFAGWTEHERHLPPGPVAALTVYRPAVIRTWSLGLALVVFASLVRLRGRFGLIVPTAGLLFAAGLIASPALASLLFAASLGVAVGGCVQLLRLYPRSATTGGQSETQDRFVVAGRVTALSLVFCLGADSQSALAQEDQDQAMSRRVPESRVIIPIDDRQQPVGEYVFLDHELYDSLHRLSQLKSGQAPSCLLEAAHYDLPARPRTSGSSPAIDNIRTQFSFHTLLADATVELPLRRDQVLLLEGQARLDGQPVRLVWRNDGLGLLFLVAAPGKHRLDLSFGAAATWTDGGVLLELSIPPAPRTTVGLPPGADVEVSSVPNFQQRAAPAAGLVPLGLSRRLVARWRQAEGAEGRAKSVQAEQLLWWNVRPGSVLVEGRFRLRPSGGSVREVVIAADPRLRLVPITEAGASMRIKESAANLVRIELAEPTSSEVPLRLSWVWPDVSGVGTLVLPQIAIRADSLTRDWTAVSTGDGLETETESIGSPSANEFVKAWGDPLLSPKHVVALGRTAEIKQIVMSPVWPPPTVQQSSDWSLSRTLAAARIDLRLTAVPRTRFEHRMVMSPLVRVKEVSLHQDGRRAAMRWSQHQDGALVVTLQESPLPEQQLIVELATPLDGQLSPFTLPNVRLHDVSPASSQLRLYRRGDLLVHLESLAGWTQHDDPAVGDYSDEFGRLVAVLRTDAPQDAAQPVVSRTANEPQVSGVMLTRVHEEDGDWRVELELQLEISNGELDHVRLTVPDQWPDPLESDPPAQNIVAAPGETRRHVAVRLPRPVKDKLHMTIRGPLTNTGSGVAAPDVNLLSAPDVPRMLLLDSRSAGERIEWQTTGLEASSSPDALPASWASGEGEFFRVVAPRFDAVASIGQPTKAAPRVHLAEAAAHLQPGSEVAYSATFLIQPAGGRDITVEMPVGTCLVQVLTDDVVAQCTQVGPRSWKVAAPSMSLPYRLTVVYGGAHLGSGRNVALAAPRLVGTAVERTIWTVIANDHLMQIARPQPASRSCMPWEVELARVEAAARCLEDVAAARGGDLPAGVIPDAAARWRRAYRDSRSNLESLAPPLSAEGEPWGERLDAAEQTIAKIEQRLAPIGTSGALDELATRESQVEVDRGSETSQFMVRGPGETLLVQLAPPAMAPHERRNTWVGLLAIFSLFLWPILRSSLVHDWLAAQAPLALTVMGLAWWLIAPLGWLGLLLVLTSIWLAIRWPWRRTAHSY